MQLIMWLENTLVFLYIYLSDFSYLTIRMKNKTDFTFEYNIGIIETVLKFYFI